MGNNPSDREEQEKKLQRAEEFIYFQGLENTMQSKVMERIILESEEVRTKIKERAGIETLDDEALNKIRKTSPKIIINAVRAAIKAGKFDDEQEYIERYIEDNNLLKDYSDMVRAELGKQIKYLEGLSQKRDLNPEEQEKIRAEYYEIALKIIDFFVANRKDMDGSRQMLRVFLIKKIKSPKGLEYLTELYKSLQYLSNVEGSGRRNEAGDNLSDSLAKEAKDYEEEDFIEVMAEYAADINLSEEERRNIWAHGVSLDSYSFKHRMAMQLENIEVSRFHLEQLKLTVKIIPGADELAFNQEQQKRQEAMIKHAVEKIKVIIAEFRESRRDFDSAIDSSLQKKVSPRKRKKLKEAVYVLDTIRSEKEGHKKQPSFSPIKEKLLAQIYELGDSQSVDAFIAAAEDEVLKYLYQNGFDEEDIERDRKNNPSFDVFKLYSQRKNRESEIETEEEKGHKFLEAFGELRELDKFEKNSEIKGSDNRVSDAIAAINAYHYTTGINADVAEKLMKAIDASGLDKDQKKRVYIEFIEVLSRNSDLEMRGLAMELRDEMPEIKDEEIRSKEKLPEDEGMLANQAEEESKDLDAQKFISGGKLLDIQSKINELEKITKRKFSQAGDFDKFDKLTKEIDGIARGEYYLATEAVRDSQERTLTYEGEHITRRVSRPKTLPFLDEDKLDSILRQKLNFEQYKHIIDLGGSKDKILENVKDNPSNLRKALSALFTDHYKVGAENVEQSNKLAKVMSLDHPMTALRFNNADKVPFEGAGGYQYHKVGGKPATFKDRAVALIEQVRELTRLGDFVGIERLFRFGELADRLYIDSVFFPTSKLQREAALPKRGKGRESEGVIYQFVYDKQSDSMHKVLTDKIPTPLESMFKESKRQKIEADLDKDQDFKALPQQLIKDKNFYPAFHRMNTGKKRENMENFEGNLRYDDEGNLIEQESQFAELEQYVRDGGAVHGLGIKPGYGRIPQEKLDAINKDYPLVANRMAQMQSELAAWPLAGAEMAGRKLMGYTAMVPKAFIDTLKNEWKNVQMVSTMSAYMAINEAIEHIGKITEFHAQYGAYRLLSNIFEGTIVGSEFNKLMQQKEDERVNQFKEAFNDYGHDQVIDKLYTAKDRFELKASLIEGFENRGVLSMNDLLDRRFIKNINKQTPTKVVSLAYSDTEMKEDEEVRSKILMQLKDAIDEIWGPGTFLGWKNAGVSKYNDKMKQAENEAGGNSNPETHAKLVHIFKKLCSPSGIRELKKEFHPAEILGFIAEDCAKGDMDSWEPYAVLQGCVIEKVISNEDFVRLQGEHANDWVLHAIVEFQQAKNSGMDKAWEAAKRKGVYDENEPFFGFFQGHKSLSLKTVYKDGKFVIPKTAKEFKEAEAAGTVIEMPLTGADIQQSHREFQPEYHKKLDNSACALSVKYPIGQILAAHQESAAGQIDVRPHDAVAKLRGFHFALAADFDNLENFTEGGDQQKFDRLCYFAYKNLASLYGYVEHFTHHLTGEDGKPRLKAQKNQDYSPASYKPSIKENCYNKSGTSNFNQIILGVEGGHQRILSQGEPILTNTFAGRGVNAQKFMASVKLISGMQFLRGIDPITGEMGGPAEKFNLDWNPVDHFKEAMPRMVEYMREIAAKKKMDCNFGKEEYGFEDPNGIDYDKVIKFKTEAAAL